jgi:hypothetical protein
LPGRDFVDLPGEVVEERVLDHLLVKFRVLATAMLARVVHEKLALADARGREGIRLDDVRAGFEETAMDVADHLGLREREKIAVVLQVFLRVGEALGPDVFLGHPVGADGRAHGAVDDGNTLAKEGGEWMTRGHGTWNKTRLYTDFKKQILSS